MRCIELHRINNYKRLVKVDRVQNKSPAHLPQFYWKLIIFAKLIMKTAEAYDVCFTISRSHSVALRYTDHTDFVQFRCVLFSLPMKEVLICIMIITSGVWLPIIISFKVKNYSLSYYFLRPSTCRTEKKQ